MADELEEALMGMALGDETQTSRVAAYLRSNEQPQGPSLVQQQLQELEGRKAYLKKVLTWARENPDVAYDDEAYVHAVQVDANLAKAYPEMTEERRLAFAADITREELGEAQERDYGHAIRSMRARRQGGEVEDKPSRGGDVSPEERISREIDADRTNIISQMRKDREELRTTTARAYSGPLKEDYRRAQNDEA